MVTLHVLYNSFINVQQKSLEFVHANLVSSESA